MEPNKGHFTEMKIGRIISNVQAFIGDEDKELVQTGMYIDWLNEVAIDVAKDTQIWIGRYIANPARSSMQWSPGQTFSFGDIVEKDNKYYYCINQHFSTDFTVDIVNWDMISEWEENTLYEVGDRVWDSGPTFYASNYVHTSDYTNRPPGHGTWSEIGELNTQSYSVILPYMDKDNLLAPYKVFRVTRISKTTEGERKVIECHEVGKSAIGRTTSGNKPYKFNSIEIENAFTIKNVNSYDSVDGSLTLVFSQPFSYDEQVVIDYISIRPWGESQELMIWESLDQNTQEIPDYMYEVFFWGLLWKVTSYLFFRGNEIFATKMKEALGQYESRKLSISSYSKLYKDTRSTLTPKPFKML